MTDLSPAQKTLDAFNKRHEPCGPFDDDWAEQCLAAALEAVADQVVPEYQTPSEPVPSIRAGLLAIANELEGHHA